MRDRAHEIADRAAARKQAEQQGEQSAEQLRQERLRQEGGGITQAEAERLGAGQTTAYRRGR